MQLSVSNDIPAITTSSFKQLNVPTIATLIDLWTCNNSLSFYFETLTANLTAKLTYTSATMTAQMNSSVLNSATHATSLFLLHDKDNSEIMTPSLLLPFNQDNPAITTATQYPNKILSNDPSEIPSSDPSKTPSSDPSETPSRDPSSNPCTTPSSHSSHHSQRLFQVD